MANPIKVLIIDDSPEDQELYRRSLRGWPGQVCKIFVADDSETGLEAIESFRPDIVLLDYLMPDMNGLEFLDELKQRAKHDADAPGLARQVGIKGARLNAAEASRSESLKTEMFEASPSEMSLLSQIPPIIMLTGQGSEKVAVKAMKEGIVDYVLKGDITPQFLRSTVNNALKQRRLHESLERAEERFRASIETMLDSFGTYASIRDEQGNITRFQTEYINAAACGRSNMTVEQRGEELFVVEPPQWTEELFQEYCQVVETGVPLSKEIVIYDEDASPSGHSDSIQHAYDLRATRLGDGFVAVWREITGKKRAELERLQLLAKEQQARAAAEEANQLKDTIVAMVSHDLRAPLNSILGWVQMLRRRPSERVLDQAVRIIERSANTQLSLIEDLMDVSRIIRGSLTLNVQPLNLTDVLGTVVTSLYPLLENKQLTLFLSNGQESIKITQAEQIGIWLARQPHFQRQGDSNRLNQTFTNLLSNAIKFTPAEGNIEVSLAHSCHQQQEEQVHISFKDSGIGIEPDKLELIFNRFQQAESSRRSEGLGLGLTIAQHITELHSGRLWAESEGQGKGAKFLIELPLTTA